MFQPTFYSPFDVKSLDILLECLTRLNQHYLYQNPHTPRLYESGIRYERESNGTEEWLTIPEVISRGVGDCEDLCAWLAAEYRVRGVLAQAFASRVPKPPGTRPLFHVRVRLGNGKIIEDPSKVLGMPG